VRSRALIAALGALIPAACGSSSPSISSVTLDRTQIAVGAAAYAVVAIHAPEGDVDRGLIELSANRPGDDSGVSTRTPVIGVVPGTIDATVIVEFQLHGGFGLGAYDLVVIVDANDGKASEPKSARFAVVPPPG
jgi:hypothetical protein